MGIRGAPGVQLVQLAASALVALLLVGCGGGSHPATAPRDSAPVSSSPPAQYTPPPAPTLPRGEAAPSTLRGRWVAVDNDGLFLTLEPRLYTVVAGAGPVRGEISVRGRTMFFLSPNCPLGVGRYRWTLTNHRLRLHPEKTDPCVNRAGAIADRAFRLY